MPGLPEERCTYAESTATRASLWDSMRSSVESWISTAALSSTRSLNCCPPRPGDPRGQRGAASQTVRVWRLSSATELPNEPHHGVVVLVDHALLEGDDRVVG